MTRDVAALLARQQAHPQLAEGGGGFSRVLSGTPTRTPLGVSIAPAPRAVAVHS